MEVRPASTGSRRARAWPAWLVAAPAALVGAVLLLPFLHKAWTIDDLTFLVMARHALVDPLHPSAVELVFHGERGRISAGMVSGPIMPWLMLPSLWLGGVEWPVHLAQIGLLALGAVSTAALALRTAASRAQAGTAAMLVVTAPAVLGMAATGMPDVAAMAFGALGMERLRAFAGERRAGQGIAAALALLLAILSRPHAVLLLGCGALWLLPWPDRAGIEEVTRAPLRQARALWPVGLVVPLFLVVNWLTRDPEAGHSIAGTTAARIESSNLLANVANWFAQAALSMPLALPWVALRARRGAGGAHTDRGLFGAVLVGAALAVNTGRYRELWWLLPVLAASAAAVFDVVRGALRSRDRDALVLAAWLLIALPMAVYLHLPAKFLVPSAPAIALIVARAMGASPTRRGWIVASAASMAGALLGVLIVRADTAAAEVGRIGGATVAAAVGRGEQVWCDGSWGFQWYAMEAGATPIASAPPWPRPGDVVVRGIGAGKGEAYTKRRLLARTTFESPGGRVMSPTVGAGFFSNGFGYLPWAWGSDDLGPIEVWLVE